MRMKNRLIGLAGCCLLAVVSSASAQQFDEFNCLTGIVYKTVNGEALDMALFLPTVKKYEKTPIMIYTHGGGWRGGDKKNIFRPPFFETLQILTSNGIACAAIEYRLTRPGISTAYDCVVDCKDAARFIVKHANEYGLDPDRMGVWGGSAGGHLCLMLALAPDELFPGAPELREAVLHFRCVASYFPATTFIIPEVLVGSNFENPNRFTSFLGGSYEEKKDLAAKISPAEYLNPSSPPILLLHGDKDQVLSYKNATYMVDVAKEKGANVELLTVTNALHSFVGSDICPSISEINRISAEFILKNMTPGRP